MKTFLVLKPAIHITSNIYHLIKFEMVYKIGVFNVA